ncbi:hypothetical protein DJ030_12715 [bacterium endosymbiont of Escarpia laminata]|nr:MAG: hypothetical protein DJ031_12270 [bacterium endosymbiont of Escarpia laminata]RLJ18241.1 MAG: hypothetical protein DJ030_12715 [bacterium endosymbiont of Escarpia laminata]
MNPNRTNGNDIADLIREACFTDARASKLLKVGIRSIKRWKSGASLPPHTTIILLQVMAHGLGHLPGAGKKWKGWTFKNGLLTEPFASHAQQQHSPTSITGWWWASQMLQVHRAEENVKKRHISESENVVSIGAVKSPWRDATDELYAQLKDGQGRGE